MTVTLTISSAIGGDSISDTVDLGSIASETSSLVQDLYIRHDDGINEITDCELYLTRYTGFDYPGDDADADLNVLLSTASPGWGVDKGVKLNMNPTTPAWAFLKYGAGDVEFPVELSEDAIVGTSDGDGVVPARESAHIQTQVTLPVSPGSARHMAFGLVFSFSSTS